MQASTVAILPSTPVNMTAANLSGLKAFEDDDEEYVNLSGLKAFVDDDL